MLIDISENLIKQAALISVKYQDRTLSSIIEECFFYGAKSLYSEAPKVTPPVRKPLEEYFNNPVEEKYLSSIQSLSDNIVQNAQDTVYNDEDIPESLGKAVISKDGLFEL